MKKHRLYLLILFSTVLGFVLVEIYKPKPINWTQTYSSKDKIPYGCELLYKLLPQVFRNQQISDSKVPIYHKSDEWKNRKSNYIYVYQYFRADLANLSKLLKYVQEGNNAFIAAEDFYGLNDTLHFETAYLQKFTKDSVNINFENPALKPNKPYLYHHQSIGSYFLLDLPKDSLKKVIIKTNAKILGKNYDGKPNFIKIDFGKGAFYLSTVPKAFSNFYLVKDNNADYAFKALSYLPENQVFWDEYASILGFGKKDRSILKAKNAKGEDDDIDTSPFKFIVSQPALKWAYFITLASLCIYLIFEGKRKQRIIPIIETPQNTSLTFVETIGALYYNQKDHQAISEKKIAYLLTYIRNKFHLKTTVIDQEFREDLSRKSNLTISEINKLFDYVENIQISEKVTEKDLIKLNKYIEDFYQKT